MELLVGSSSEKEQNNIISNQLFTTVKEVVDGNVIANFCLYISKYIYSKYI